jgi:hypothetical protein
MAACVAGFDGGCRMGAETIPFTPITPIHIRDAVSTGLLQVQFIDEYVALVRAQEDPCLRCCWLAMIREPTSRRSLPALYL